MTQPPPQHPQGSSTSTGGTSRGGIVAIIVIGVAVLALLVSGSLLAGRVLSTGSSGGSNSSSSSSDSGSGSDSDGPDSADDGLGKQAGNVALSRPLRFATVSAATPGRCSGGSDSAYELDRPRPECLHLGGGFLVIHLKAIAVTSQDGGARYRLRITLNDKGTRALADLTAEARADRIALVSGEHLIAAPTANGPITGGDLVLSGNFSKADATRLYDQITAGS